MGIKQNFGYNMILTGANYLFPMLVFPYVARILGADLLGTCSFVDGILNYVVILSALGIGSFGVREVARVRGNQVKLNELYSTLVVVNILLTILWLTIYLGCVFFVPRLHDLKEFCWIGCIKILFSAVLVEWLYQGLEQFRYITIRSVFVRLAYVIAIFLFVRSKEDVLVYFSLLSVTTAVNAIVNWTYAKKLVHFSFKRLNYSLYILPIISFGYYIVMTSLYASINGVYLGFITNETEVGYFTVASKIVTIAISVFSAFTTVMIPRVSKWMGDNEDALVNRSANQCVALMILTAMPIAIYCLAFADDIVYIIAGGGYSGAVLPFRIVSVLIIILGLSQVVVRQFLMANTRSNKSIMILSTFGAVVGIGLNIILTKRLLCVGSCIAWTVSEISILILATVLTVRATCIKFDYGKIFRAFLSTLVLLPCLWICNITLENEWVRLSVGGLVTVLGFIFIVWIWVDQGWFNGVLPKRIENILLNSRLRLKI